MPVSFDGAEVPAGAVVFLQTAGELLNFHRHVHVLLTEGGRHLVENGLLLRSDIDRLFDAGYVTVTPDYRVRVSRRLRDEYDNGEPYYPLEGQEIWQPPRTAERPRREFLEWHGDVVWRG